MDFEKIKSELIFKAVRSSGKGGQHVNKVATKIELLFDLENSLYLLEEEKLQLQSSLSSKLTRDNTLILQCSETRSQLKNKQIVIQRLYELLLKGLEKKKERKPTKIPKSEKAKRLKDKKIKSDRKASRQKPKID